VDGIVVTASIKDRSDSFYAELEVSNHSQRILDIRPQDVQLQVIQPGSKNLSFVPADVVAKRVLKSENRRAFNIEAAGAGAFRTVVEHVPVTDVTPNPESINDPTKPAVTVSTRIDVRTKTEPDDLARMAAASQAASIRRSAEAEGEQILSAGLKTILLIRDSQTEGRVYYEREKSAREVLLRIPLGELTVEIPFTAVMKSGLIRFE
jgi:hypothetical protein